MCEGWGGGRVDGSGEGRYVFACISESRHMVHACAHAFVACLLRKMRLRDESGRRKRMGVLCASLADRLMWDQGFSK